MGSFLVLSKGYIKKDIGYIFVNCVKFKNYEIRKKSLVLYKFLVN